VKHSTDTISRDSPKRAFLFIALLILWGGLILFGILLLKGSPEQQYKSVYYSLEATKSFLALLRQLFLYADDWNWITLSTILSFAVILFNFNDIYLKRIFARWTYGKEAENFYYAGSFWFVRILSNTAISILQFILVAYLINISIGTQRIFTLKELDGTYDVVLLGTSKYLTGTKNINQYYNQRIQATLELYRDGKVNSILISGDHKGDHYSEPLDMQKDLVKGGVPKKLITLDYSGYRTFDSILKLKKKKNDAPLLFISQQFHLERALFIANNSGIDAVGFAANGDMTVQMVQREAFAKTKVILDIYILNTQAFGMPAHPRRHLSIFKGSDLILLFFVLGIVVVAGRLSRGLLVF
jgi:SanA protein